MIRKFATIFVLLLALALAGVPTAANAQGFILGLATGGLLFGGNTQYGGGNATILYSADEETLKKTDPLSVRMVATGAKCFYAVEWKRAEIGKPLGEMFADTVHEMSARKRTILQIIRVFSSDNPGCAAIWFSYVEN